MRKIKFKGWMLNTGVVLGLLIGLNLMPPVATGKGERVEFLQDTIEGALARAREAKKFLVCYLYGDRADYYYYNRRHYGVIPANLAHLINQESKNRTFATKYAIFVKVTIRSTRAGEIQDKKIIEFFKIRKLPAVIGEPYLIIMDSYGNVFDQISIPLTQYKVIKSLKNSIQEAKKVASDLKRRYKKVDKLRKKGDEAAVIKGLNEIIDTNWQGYEYFEKAGQDLEEISESVKDRFKDIIKDFLAEAKEDRDKEATLSFLKDFYKTYKALELSKQIKEAIELIKDDNDNKLKKMRF